MNKCVGVQVFFNLQIVFSYFFGLSLLFDCGQKNSMRANDVNVFYGGRMPEVCIFQVHSTFITQLHKPKAHQQTSSCSPGLG